MRVEDGEGYCPECKCVVDLVCENNSWGTQVVYDYIPFCNECGAETDENEPDPEQERRDALDIKAEYEGDLERERKWEAS